MNADVNMITIAKAKAMMSGSLRRASRAMFADKKKSPYPEAKDFNEWLEKELDFLALMIGRGGDITADKLVFALREELLGEPLVEAMAENSRRNGWRAVSFSYLEDGKVFSNLFVSGKSAEENMKEACAIQSTCAMTGHNARVELSDEDLGEFCVLASIDFFKSLPKTTKGGMSEGRKNKGEAEKKGK